MSSQESNLGASETAKKTIFFCCKWVFKKKEWLLKVEATRYKTHLTTMKFSPLL